MPTELAHQQDRWRSLSPDGRTSSQNLHAEIRADENHRGTIFFATTPMDFAHMHILFSKFLRLGTTSTYDVGQGRTSAAEGKV
jgi:hypothetical protein